LKNIQYNPLLYPVYVLIKPIGSACNLDCSYCYYLEKNDRFNIKNKALSLSQLENFTRQYVNCQPTQNTLFTWHGGEPLLMGLDYFRKAVQIQKETIKNQNLFIDNVIQTNGTLLNDEWCEFFKLNNFLVGLSLDGPEHCHDKYRNHLNGKSSFKETMRGLHLLQKHEVEFNVLSTINHYNSQYPLEVYDFFKSNEIKYIQFSPVVERKNEKNGMLCSADEAYGILTEWSVKPLAYGNFLNKIFDTWINNDVGETFVTTFDATLACYAGVEPGTCLYTKTCGHSAALQPDGNLYSCDHYVFENFKLGNIEKNSITEMMLSEKQIRFGYQKRDNLPDACLKCPYLNLCNGECPRNRFIKTDNEKYPINYLCEGLKLYFSHTEPYWGEFFRD